MQVVFPLALLLWLLIAPVRNRIGWTLQATSTGLILLWLAAAGLWTKSPWWMPWVYMALWAGGLWNGLRRWRSSASRPQGVAAWIVAGLLLVLGGYAGHEATYSWAGQRAPDAPLQAMLACGDVQVALADFRQGSLRVHVGDAVRAGQQLA